MTIINTRKRILAAVGVAATVGALTFGGIAYATGDGAADSGYVSVLNDPGNAGSTGSAERGAAPSGREDCPEKYGSGQDGQARAPQQPSEQVPAPSAEDL